MTKILSTIRSHRILSNHYLLIAIFGFASWLAYLHLATTYPLYAFIDKHLLTDFGRVNGYIQPALYDFLYSLFIPFGLYLLAWQLVQQLDTCSVNCKRAGSKDQVDVLAVSKHLSNRRLLWLICGFAVLFAVTLLVMYPITATDMFDYVFYSRIFVRYHQNPLVVPPIKFPSDPFLKTVIWYKSPAPYGPLWILLTAPGSMIAGDDLKLNLLMMDALPVLFFFASIAIVALVLRRIEPEHLLPGVLLFAWNPLVLFEVAGNGHNGMIMLFFILVAIYFVVRGWWLWVLPALVLSVLVKYISAILLLPFLIYCWRAQEGSRHRLRFLALTGGISALLALGTFSPFLSFPTGLLDEANWYSLLSFPTLVFQYLKIPLGESDAKTWVFISSTVAYLVIYVFSFRYLSGKPVNPKGAAETFSANENPRFGVLEPKRLILWSTWLKMIYLAIACVYFQPWFIKWLITLGIWTNHTLLRRMILTFTASGLISYAVSFFWVWNWKVWDKAYVNGIFVAVIFGPPMLVGLLSVGVDAWRRSRVRAQPVAVEIS